MPSAAGKATCRPDSSLVAAGSADASPLKVNRLGAGMKHRCTVGDEPVRQRRRARRRHAASPSAEFCFL
jgi:hypothetical protein